MPKPHFRAGVVAVVVRSDGQVLAFERADLTGEWQLPQGGIEPGETASQAAWRELREETGLDETCVSLTGDHPDWTVYEWPGSMRSSARIGQAHRWFFFEALRDDIEPTPDGDEFTNWRWMQPADLIGSVVGFRRGPYTQVLGTMASERRD